jgi:hypothetical protein
MKSEQNLKPYTRHVSYRSGREECSNIELEVGGFAQQGCPARGSGLPVGKAWQIPTLTVLHFKFTLETFL